MGTANVKAREQSKKDDHKYVHDTCDRNIHSRNNLKTKHSHCIQLCLTYTEDYIKK